MAFTLAIDSPTSLFRHRNRQACVVADECNKRRGLGAVARDGGCRSQGGVEASRVVRRAGVWQQWCRLSLLHALLLVLSLSCLFYFVYTPTRLT